ncbi:complex I NDUFA9 subunit family protein [Deferribacter autotrophicus]|uniref:Complex I NDUFA9 subunit family protein n=1 Tax=Deferribacter autotrophicus TaxID=500465 RepID=A0A5A8F3G1_9BACT|nr:complex I NDUFA9 subunit family protein [Deferribacter autotrophicus]KAA0257024.1 complex I NDUFA9 subunit family protein [Deferribacter autotrophicus]
MKIFLTGGTGFVGTEILKTLLKYGYEPIVLVRDPVRLKVKDDRIQIVVGDALKPESYSDALKDVDTVIHLVGIIREFPSKGVTFEKMHYEATKLLVDETVKANVKRFIHMSANGAREDGVTTYHKTKFRAEEYVRNSGLTYTIFKPSIIYGPDDSFINMLNDFMKKMPVFSYFGDGSYPMQPVSVYEVAEIFVKSIENEKTFNKTFTVCGNKILSYKEILKLIMEITGRKRVLIPVPEFIIDFAIKLFGKFSWFPIARDQFEMLREGNTCENNEIFQIMGIIQKDIEKTLSDYLK